ncbi:MAG: DUF2804 domain-containing protein [Candidatus Nanopelagicales bacterium]
MAVPLTPTAVPPPVAPAILLPDGTPEFGVYSGIPVEIDYSDLTGPWTRNAMSRFLRHKRWLYVFVATDEIVLISAIVDAGPTGTGFIMITDRATGEVLADASRPGGAGPLTGVGDSPVVGHRSHYTMPGTIISASGDERELQFRAQFHSLPFAPFISDPMVQLDLRLATDVHPGITAVSEIEQDSPLVTATAKNAALPARGQLTLRRDGRATDYDLSGGLGGFDYTNGFLPRHTAWRWAYLTGRLGDGRPVGLNLVSGFSGIGDNAHENICWIDGSPHRLDPAARIIFDAAEPRKPWQVTTTDGAVDLQFTPLAVHSENLNLGAVRSRFIQPSGHFSGTIRVADQTLTIDELPGVVEDQDVLW